VISDEVLLSYLVAHDDDIETLRRLEKAAIGHIQNKTGEYHGVIAAQTDELLWRGWPMQLKSTPVGALTSFKSWDGSAFTAVDATSYYLSGRFIYWNTRMAPRWSPLTMPYRYQAVYNAGYTQLEDPNDTDAPEEVKQAVLLLVGHWYENREAAVAGVTTEAIEMGVDALLSGHTRQVV
jgi:uncharacterized phiE125 gp8 family phage protein